MVSRNQENEHYVDDDVRVVSPMPLMAYINTTDEEVVQLSLKPSNRNVRRLVA